MTNRERNKRSRDNLRKRFPITDGMACQRCGREKVRLVRHHKDGNPLNGRTSNIMVVCPGCHRYLDAQVARRRKERELK